MFSIKKVAIFLPKFRVLQLDNSCTKITFPIMFSTNTEVQNQKKLVVVDIVDGITRIGINRPEKKNCVNNATAIELCKAFDNFENNDESPVAILYGKGGTFCAGYDLAEASGTGGDANLLENDHFNPENKYGWGPMGPSRKFFKKPVIASVNGFAVAGGLELSLMCDLRVMEKDAVMGVFCRRFGVPLIDGGTVRLPHLIGLSRAMDLILTGRPVTGKEAYDIGLANRLVQTGTCLEQSMILAKTIAAFPQQCMNKDRMSANNAMYNSTSFQDAVKYEENGLDVIFKESVQGATKFVKGIGRHGVFNSKI